MALGNELERIVFTNAGRGACLLRGYPTLTGVDARGVRRALRARTGGTYFGRLSAAAMRPHGSVYLDLATSSACDNGLRRPRHYHDVVFTLPQGGRIRARRLSVSVTCGLAMSRFGLPTRYTEQHPRPGTPGALHALLRLPQHARRGATLTYTVTLQNSSAGAIPLRPCPGYTESLVTTRRVVHRSYALNCSSVRAVPADGRVRYLMELTIPANARLGVAKVAWNLNTPTGPFTGGAVVIG